MALRRLSVASPWNREGGEEQSPGPGRGQAGTGGKGQGRRGDGTGRPDGRFWVRSWRPLAVKGQEGGRGARGSPREQEVPRG